MIHGPRFSQVLDNAEMCCRVAVFVRRDNWGQAGTNTITLTKYIILKMGNGNITVQYMDACKNCPLISPPNSVLIETNEIKEIDVEKIFELLFSYVEKQVVNYGSSWYMVKQGLPHGATLSAALCNFYYGTVDRHFDKLVSEEDTLVRIVDDYLFVTQDKQRAERFFNRMTEGFPKFNCNINKRKTQVNFSVGESLSVDKITFCGHVIDTCTLEVTGDYKRYKGKEIAYTMRLNNVGHPGKNPVLEGLILYHNPTVLSHQNTTIQLDSDNIEPTQWYFHQDDDATYHTSNESMALINNFFMDPVISKNLMPSSSLNFRFLRERSCLLRGLKLDPLYLDGRINRQSLVLQSVFNAAVLSAFRLHAIICHTFTSLSRANQWFVLRIIAACASSLARKVLKATQAFPARWLTFKAYYVKLSHHGIRYRLIVRRLEHLLERNSRDVHRDTLKVLEETTAKGLPHIFKTVT
ncbi:unnamed protein product [Timema podura]|uniref:Telomerase reverse transcriptase n=1 Tax=Timema podura TaxID=61482 RepID=A0ABN7NV06_TIMPD|nr:unnamed protein product [Timema podura]